MTFFKYLYLNGLAFKYLETNALFDWWSFKFQHAFHLIVRRKIEIICKRLQMGSY